MLEGQQATMVSNGNGFVTRRIQQVELYRLDQNQKEHIHTRTLKHTNFG